MIWSDATSFCCFWKLYCIEKTKNFRSSPPLFLLPIIVYSQHKLSSFKGMNYIYTWWLPEYFCIAVQSLYISRWHFVLSLNSKYFPLRLVAEVYLIAFIISPAGNRYSDVGQVFQIPCPLHVLASITLKCSRNFLFFWYPELFFQYCGTNANRKKMLAMHLYIHSVLIISCWILIYLHLHVDICQKCSSSTLHFCRFYYHYLD